MGVQLSAKLARIQNAPRSFSNVILMHVPLLREFSTATQARNQQAEQFEILVADEAVVGCTG